MKKFKNNTKIKTVIIGLTLVTASVITTFLYSGINKPEVVVIKSGPIVATQQSTTIETQIPAISKPDISAKDQTAVVVSQKDTSSDIKAKGSEVTTTSIQAGSPKAGSKPVPPPAPKIKDNIADKNKVPTYAENDIKPQLTQPEMGDRNENGQIYVDGFGWVKNEGGGSTGTSIGSEGDHLTGNKVGSMD